MNDASNWILNLRGRFLVFDGPDGCGKTTQWHRFTQYVEAAGISVCAVREPGGTQIGEQVRQIVLDPAHDQPLVATCEMLLFMASRAQLVAQRIKPALALKQLVLADRFVSSTLAYQGTAGGLATEHIQSVASVALGGCAPDLVVVFDVDDQSSAQRLLAKPKRSKYVGATEPTLFSDRIELKGVECQRAVRRGYLEQARACPNRYLVIDATVDADTVFDRLIEVLAARFG